MNWLDRNLFARGLSKEVGNRTFEESRAEPPQVEPPPAPSVLVWKERDGSIQSVAVECDVTD